MIPLGFEMPLGRVTTATLDGPAYGASNLADFLTRRFGEGAVVGVDGPGDSIPNTFHTKWIARSKSPVQVAVVFARSRAER